MSCGTKIIGAHRTYSERYDLSEKLENEGEYRLARAVRHGECLGWSDLRRAENALESQGMSRNWDFREEHCQCETED